jgi:transposase
MMPARVVEITEAEREHLGRLLRADKTPCRIAQRARIVLLAAEGMPAARIAELVGCTERNVQNWRTRFDEERLAGLEDRARAGRPRTLSPEEAREILRRTVEEIPREATHWSLRLMEEYAGVSRHQVAQVWEAAGLKPHRLKTFKISKDPLFAEKVQDVVGLYLAPPVGAMVLSVDEETQIQALDRTQPMLPLRPGQLERRTHDYKRHGTRSLYAAFDVASGHVVGRVTARPRANEFIEFLRQIDRATPPELDLHLIVDNSSTHKTKSVQAWLAQHLRFTLHFTPTSASWLNAVESWFSSLERRSLHRGIFTSVAELRDEIHRYISAHDERLKPFVWTKSAESIIDSHRRVGCKGEETFRSGH